MNPELVLNLYSFLENADRSKVRGLTTLSNTGTAPKYNIVGHISNEALIALNVLKAEAKQALGKRNFLTEEFFGKRFGATHFKLAHRNGVFMNICTIVNAPEGPFDKAFDILLGNFLERFYESVIIPSRRLSGPTC